MTEEIRMGVYERLLREGEEGGVSMERRGSGMIGFAKVSPEEEAAFDEGYFAYPAFDEERRLEPHFDFYKFGFDMAAEDRLMADD